MLIKKSILFLIIISIIISCTPPPVVETERSWAEETLQELTLREKIAQMLIYRMHLKFRNSEDKQWQEIIDLVESDGIGGIHLWSGNTGLSVTMLNELQERSKVPIIIDMDIEYGLEQRFPEGTAIPPAMALTASNYLANAYDAAKIVAHESRSAGIHWILGPVVDVNNNPENPIINVRSFSDDPQVVTDFASAYIKGLHSENMLATAKHFPGHGDTQTDSHLSLTNIPSDSTRLWSVELAPYKAIIDAGVDAIMVSHLVAPDYQPNSYTPATLSKFWVQNILREKLGFNGVIVTDAVDMGSITKNYSDAYALVTAVYAGCDVIIQNDNYKYAIDVIEQAVLDSAISIERINESALRMLKIKEKAGLQRSRITSFETMRENIGKYESRKIAQKMANQSIVIVKNDSLLLPLKSFNDTITVIDIYNKPFSHDQSFATKELIKNRIPIESFVVDESDSPMYLRSIGDSIKNESKVILNVFAKPSSFKGSVGLVPAQNEFINNLFSKTNNIVMISYGNPYLIREFPQISTFVCAWYDQINLQIAGANAVIGKGDFNGKLPIDIPTVAKRGDGFEIKSSFKPLRSDWQLPAQTVKRVLPAEVGADITHLLKMLNKAVSDSAFPGGILLAAKNGKIFIEEPVGYHTYSKIKPITKGSIFDLASITKVVATTSAVMKLVDDGKLKLEDTVGKYLPEFVDEKLPDIDKRKKVNIEQLLTHRAGLKPFELFYKLEDMDAIIRSILCSELESEPGENVVYSDIGFMLLGMVVERISGEHLNKFVESKLFDKLGMTDTFFNPDNSKMKRIVPSEYSQIENDLICGHVHDENAFALGGVSGHAGLFSSAHDLAIFAQMMLNLGAYGKEKIFNKSTVKLFTSDGDSTFSNRLLGWEKPSGQSSGGVYLSDHSFGHTGFTGTSIWIDPKNNIFVILLTNAVHPNRGCKDPKYYDWRQRIHSAVYEALGYSIQNPNLKWRKDW